LEQVINERKMQTKISIAITGMIMIITMTGCPYESPVPLSNSCNSLVDPALIGTWIFPSTAGNNDTVEIMRFNEHEYYLEFHEKRKNGNIAISRGRGFVTMIKNQKIINYCELGNPGKFMFFKYEIQDNLMKTFSPSDNFIKEPFKSGGELFDFFTRNIDRQGFYEPPDTSIRLR
jgi:hypothetical protein